MDVVINACHGGFSLSHRAVMAYAERKGIKLYPEASPISVKYHGEPTDFATYAGAVHYFKVPPEQYHALSNEIRERGESYARLNDKDWYFREDDVPRNDADLVAVVRELGDAANGQFAKLQVVTIPDDVEWEIEEYDGYEHVAEKHRTWS
jgi:hypothetical protein